MKINNPTLIQLAKMKAKQSTCRYRISAIGLNQGGDIIYQACNSIKFHKKGGGIHAEAKVMLSSPPNLRTIIICRINKSGDLLPISPCDKCKEKADKLGVKIISIKE